ncbi:protein kinase domain-containing protein [Corallococcus carmarthensis]|uniref:non-specific serine/threonine protein kinase n=1 Tax=Corallococcus carmarthensis TaxID=2316728 RepID=A0A3A8KC06_9BACT|nr:protein kinase [Corallococcus carmarthensis]NOK20824.1 protein kinase [Corallococcus carmarthensis]RKH01855.1 protein kinase [Corallococcus carmarthensis]
MASVEFKAPRGSILFTKDGFQYEFRDDLGEAHHGISLLVARRRTEEGQIKGRVLLKAIGVSSDQGMTRVKRARAKLEEQVRLASFLEHPGIFRVEGMQKAEGSWYVITEHPSGHSLCDLLTIVSECRRWFSPLFVLHVGARVAEALAHAHEAKDANGNPLNIVHRAIDLDHVFVDWKGNVRVSDFGLALSSLPGRVSSTVHRPQGDTYYASPEMLLSGRVDARSDLFNLGVVMLELATGRNLLDAPDDVTEEVKASLSKRKLVRVRRAIRRARLAGCDVRTEAAIWRAATYTQADLEALTAKLPEPLRLPLRKLLQPSPADRYPSARALASELNGWLGKGVVFGQEEAAAELEKAVTDAGQALVELGLRSRRPSSVRLDDITTR